MKAMASADLAAALPAAPVHARSQHGARSRSETGNADAGSFDTVLNDVQGAPDTSSDRTAGSAGQVGTPKTAKGSGHERALRAEKGSAPTDSAPAGTAVNAAAVAGTAAASAAGSTPSAIPAQQAARLGTPDDQAVSTSPAAATTPGTVAVTLTSGLPDPRLSVPGAALAGTAQVAAPQNAGVQAGAAQAGAVQANAVQTGAVQANTVQTAASQSGTTFPAATGLTPAANGTAVQRGASDAPAKATAQPLAGSGSMRPLADASALANSSLATAPATAPVTAPGTAPATVGALVSASAPVVAAAAGVTASVTAADAVGVSGALPGLPGVAPAESKTAGNTALDTTALDSAAPAAPAGGLDAGTPVPGATPAGQPASAPVPSAGPQPAPAAPQTAAALQPQLAKPLFTLAGAAHGQHIMTLKVSPEDIGPLTVRAHIDAAGVRIELFAPGDAGREAVRGILPELRKELTDAGFGASLDLSEQSGPGGAAQDGAAQDRAGHGTAGQGGAGGDPGRDGGGSRNGPGEPRSATRWDALADAAALRSARTLNGPQTTLDILV